MAVATGHQRTFITCPEHLGCQVSLLIGPGEQSVPAPYWATEWMKDHPHQVLMELTHHDTDEHGEAVLRTDSKGRREAYLVRVQQLMDQIADQSDRIALLEQSLGETHASLEKVERFLVRKPRMNKAWERFEHE